MATAPKDRRILVKTDLGNWYAVNHATNMEGDEGWLICHVPDGNDPMVHSPVGWVELPEGCQ